jgi:hypothetical protein
MKKFFSGIAFALAATVIFFCCTDPTGVGSNLLREDQANVVFVDTFKIISQTVKGDSVQVFSPQGALSRHLFGRMVDPLFGISEASYYGQFVPDSNGTIFITKPRIDSIVLVLPVDTVGVYGSRTQPFTMEVYELSESLSRYTTYFSDTKLSLNNLIGKGSFLPRIDSANVNVFAHPGAIGGVVRTRLPGQIRIPLNKDFGQRLIDADTSIYILDTLFIAKFKGIYLKPVSNDKGLTSFNVVTQRSGIFIYYNENGVNRQYRYLVDLQSNGVPLIPRISAFRFDRNGSILGKYLSDPNKPQDYMLVQGLGGSYGKISFPSLLKLKNVIVNQAELVLQVAKDVNDDPIFTPASQIALFYKDNEDGILRLIDDFILAGGSLTTRFGGSYIPATETAPATYKMLLSNHLQKVLLGKIKDPNLYVGVFPRSDKGGRVVFYNTNNPNFKSKLRLTYTQLNK